MLVLLRATSDHHNQTSLAYYYTLFDINSGVVQNNAFFVNPYFLICLLSNMSLKRKFSGNLDGIHIPNCFSLLPRNTTLLTFFLSEYYNCFKCNKEYARKSSLIYHEKYDCCTQVLVCCFENCMKRITRRSSMKRHMRKHNVLDWENYIRVEKY